MKESTIDLKAQQLQMMTSVSVPLSKITEVPSVKESEPMRESELKDRNLPAKGVQSLKLFGIDASNLDPSLIPQLQEFLSLSSLRSKDTPEPLQVRFQEEEKEPEPQNPPKPQEVAL